MELRSGYRARMVVRCWSAGVLEAIPQANTCVQIGDYRFETLQIKDNLIKSVRAYSTEE